MNNKKRRNESFNSSANKRSLFERALKDFCKQEFKDGEQYFAVIYGSYAYGVDTPSSDVDIMIVAGNTDNERMARCIDFVKDLHTRYHLPTDTELKYEHKVLIPTLFMEQALTGAGFKDDAGQYHIPVIEKTRECLESVKLRQRFLHGAQTYLCFRR